MKQRKFFSLVLTALFLLSLSLSGCASSEWPNQAITISIGGAAGGSSDLLIRTIAPLLEQELGQKVNAVNVVGASGGISANEVMSAKHDGYMWYGQANPIVTLSVLGAADYTMDDWALFIIAGTPGVLAVREDSPYTTAEEVIEAMRSAGGSFKMGCAMAGTPWHLQSVILADTAGVSFTHIPYQGSNPSILGCLNGEVDAVLCGLSEQSEFLAAGKLRPLAMMTGEDANIDGIGAFPSILKSVPEMGDILGKIQQFNGFFLPADTDPAVLEKVTAAFEKAMASDTMKNYCADNYMTLQGFHGEEAKTFVKSQESLFCWTLNDLGLAVKSPEDFGIERPN